MLKEILSRLRGLQGRSAECEAPVTRANLIKNFLYKGHTVELKYKWGHQWSIFIDGSWHATCPNYSDGR